MGDALAQGVLEALNVIGFPGFLRERFVPMRGNSTFVNHILICVKRRLLMGHRRKVDPQLPSTLVTAIANVKRNKLPCGLVYRQPQPLLVRIFLHNSFLHCWD
jgi:hypothetical protein